jgi:hypothetical protein
LGSARGWPSSWFVRSADSRIERFGCARMELEWSMSVGTGTGARRSGHCSSARVRRRAGNGGANFGGVTGRGRGSANGSSTVPSASAVIHGHETRRSIPREGAAPPLRCRPAGLMVARRSNLTQSPAEI